MPGNFYDTTPKCTANSEEFFLSEGQNKHFPDSVFIGKLFGPKLEVPALVDLKENPAIAFLYNSKETRNRVNTCIERLVWRLALCMPLGQTELVLYNGSSPGEVFNTHFLINDYLFRDAKVYYNGNVAKFKELIDSLYNSILKRMSVIGCANFSNMIEYNESFGKESKFKYELLILTDFPKNLDTDTVAKLHQIIKAGLKAGIFVVMSWDMNARFEDNSFSSVKIDPKSLLSSIELIYPSKDRFCFRNSGHDEVLNRFLLELDDALLNAEETAKWAAFLNKQIADFTKVEHRGKLKQDFEQLGKNEYEPVLSEISMDMGVDITQGTPISIKFNAKDYVHAFILGQSGSGKSVLLNNIITSAILKYSPDDLVLYLMDFKGVEFNRYRGEKHTKAVLVDNSDMQMTLEVLRELLEENKKRIKLWQKEGVSTIDGYNGHHPEARLPMILFVADECQMMFKMPTHSGVQREIHLEINDILNVIATQGRSQGIHLLLATQQLDDTDISGQILKNLTECILLMSAPSDSNKLVPDSSDLTEKQATGLACYYHKKKLCSQVHAYFAEDEELLAAISVAQEKADSYQGNGAAYFCGSDMFFLSGVELNNLKTLGQKYPTAIVGRNIGIKGTRTTIQLKEDFSENILFFGANKDEQTIGVLLNALASLMLSCKATGKSYDFLIIDCLSKADCRYKQVLTSWERDGLCHIIERIKSGNTFKAIANDIKGRCALPTILVIIGNERFVEMKRNMKFDEIQNEAFGGITPLGFDMTMGNGPSLENFQSAFKYILDEGPMQDVHILLQVDKPSNILFEGEYAVNATDKFNHKIILRSENKYLQPMRFSKEIDVECLSTEEEHLRAYYCHEGDDPVLFTPFQLPDENLLRLTKTDNNSNAIQ